MFIPHTPGMLRTGALLTAMTALLSGCAASTMQTQRQLEAGDLVISGAIDTPGFYVVLPRASGQATLGLGPGDLSLQQALHSVWSTPGSPHAPTSDPAGSPSSTRTPTTHG